MSGALPSGTVTFLFTDIEGSTRHLQRLGENYAGLLAAQRKLLRAAFQKYHGHEVDTQGDSFFVAFARAGDAIAASVMAQRALAAHDWSSGEVVRVRMGLHTGAPQLTLAGYVGLDVHIAARISSVAYGGQVLLSQQTHDLAEQLHLDGVSVRDLGEHRLKDLDRPRRLFQLVLSDLPTEFPPPRTLDILPHNLPIQLTSFVGRERELTEIKQLLTTTRLLTLTGAGGAGKTRLSLQVAADLVEEYKNGVWFIELAPLSDPALVPGATATALGVREQPGQPILDSLVDFSRGQEILLVLDNCEHLIEHCARLADTLLRACPNLKILATSREALGIAGETTWIVPSLSLPDVLQPRPTFSDMSQYEAVQLFSARAVAVQPSFKLTELNASAVVQICQRLDGIPLAIELAAARVKVLQTAEIAARLDDRFRLLATGNRTALPRHQTLRGAIDWSYDLLPEAERMLLRRLSVFAGGCTLDAAEFVCADETSDGILAHEILDLVSHLVDKSLVVVDKQGDETRYRMLETIREFAREKLSESRETDSIRQRHLDFMLKLAEEAGPQLSGAEKKAWFVRLENDYDNLRTAWDWAIETDTEKALRLAWALREFWITGWHLPEAQAWLANLLPRTEGWGVDTKRARALIVAGNVAFFQLNNAVADELFEQGLAIAKQSESKFEIACASFWLGFSAVSLSDFETAHNLLDASLAISRELGNALYIARAQHRLADVAQNQGEFELAQQLYSESIERFQALGSNQELAGILLSMGEAARLQGDYPRAAKLYEECIKLARENGTKLDLAAATSNLGFVLLRAGDYAKARITFETSFVLAQELGQIDAICQGLVGMAGVINALGKAEQAMRLLQVVEASIRKFEIVSWRTDRIDYDYIWAGVRSRLDKATYEKARAEGHKMTLEHGIEYALAAVKILDSLDVSAPAFSPRQAVKQEFGGLTEREREVAARIAQGESNREIAEALVVSERTVETHVTNILNKLGFESRAQIRKWAVEKGLK
jgi:predicted ATPase/class 3 adenylate cyclase/DNA-binding NarL/FixJ family response regulator